MYSELYIVIKVLKCACESGTTKYFQLRKLTNEIFLSTNNIIYS